MARYTNGVNGLVFGKVGSIVGSSWKGQPYLKARPVRLNKTKGEYEAINQSNFSILHHWLKPLLNFLRAGFKGYSEKVEGFNAAKSLALKNAFTGEKGQKVLDPALVQVSWGDLLLPDGLSVTKIGDYELSFNWDASVNKEGNKRNDQAMLLAYNDQNKLAVYELFGQFRSAGSDRLLLPKDKYGSYHVYIAFVANDRSRQSNSVYLGKIEVDKPA